MHMTQQYAHDTAICTCVGKITGSGGWFCGFCIADEKDEGLGSLAVDVVETGVQSEYFRGLLFAESEDILVMQYRDTASANTSVGSVPGLGLSVFLIYRYPRLPVS